MWFTVVLCGIFTRARAFSRIWQHLLSPRSSAPCGAAAQTCHHPSLDHPHISSESLAASPPTFHLCRNTPEFGSDSSLCLSLSLSASRHLHQRPAWPWRPSQGHPSTTCGRRISPPAPPAPAQHGPHQVRVSEQRCWFVEPSAGHFGNCADKRLLSYFLTCVASNSCVENYF